MAVVSLEEFKMHSRIDFDDEDSYLEELLESAQDSIIRETGRTLWELEGMGGGYFPRALKQAIRMLAAHWYNQREAVSSVQMSAVPYSLQTLIGPFKRVTRNESRTYEKQAKDP